MPAARRIARPIARGDVVLVPFPFSDLSAGKRRPAVVLWAHPARVDFLLAFVSSQRLRSHEVGDVAVLPTHPEFTLTGLAVPSKIRTTKLVTLSGALLKRWLGRLGPLAYGRSGSRVGGRPRHQHRALPRGGASRRTLPSRGPQRCGWHDSALGGSRRSRGIERRIRSSMARTETVARVNHQEHEGHQGKRDGRSSNPIFVALVFFVVKDPWAHGRFLGVRRSEFEPGHEVPGSQAVDASPYCAELSRRLRCRAPRSVHGTNRCELHHLPARPNEFTSKNVAGNFTR